MCTPGRNLKNIYPEYNMTEKLYYTDAYIKEFEAEVKEVIKDGDLYRVLLDKTAFFPEEGGQTADTGKIGESQVIDVREEDGRIYHITNTAPTLGRVICAVDFDTRFEKMQAHTAEHILCGIIHKLYGFENVGFHLGDDVVTFDIDGELDRADLDRIEMLANEAIYENRRVYTYFPTSQELDALSYRAKLDLRENVRIVEIDGIDRCACCAPHVAYTGEIGLIKILDFMRHRGGLRITMVAGRRAMVDYDRRYKTSKTIGALTSTPSLDIEGAVLAMHKELEQTRTHLELATREIAVLRAHAVSETEGNLVCYYPDFGADAMREFANAAIERVGGILVVLSGDVGDYKYVIASRTRDLRASSREINAALGGRGGGRPEMIQGAFSAALEEIEKYFA